MNISFEKIDRFKEIIEEAKAILQSDKCIMAISTMELYPEMREILININNSGKSKEDKQRERIEYFIRQWKLTDETAKRHGFSDVGALAESRLKQLINEELFLKASLNTFYKISMCCGYDLTTEENIIRFIREAEIGIGAQVNRADIISIAQTGIPQVKDIEAEFWSNCPTPSDVERMCNFYIGRLSGYVDTDTINWFHQKANDEHHNLKELVLCGLLDEDSFRIIKGCFVMLSAIAAGLCGEIIIFLNKLLPPVQQPIQPQQTSQYKITKDRTTDFIKLVSAMYDCRIFETIDGKVASNKKDLIKTLTGFFNAEITDYSSLLSAAKTTSNYLDIFDKIKEKGDAYYNKPPKK